MVEAVMLEDPNRVLFFSLWIGDLCGYIFSYLSRNLSCV